jgi:hypothetical protein
MRSARSSVDEAPSKSPWDIRALAWVTSERVAGERLFSRGGCAGARGDGVVCKGAVGRGGLSAGGGELVERVPDAGCGENSEQAQSSADSMTAVSVETGA